MGWLWVLLLIPLVALLIWVHCLSSMSLTDRISIALDIANAADFSPAPGFQDAQREDPSLVVWVQSRHNCVMLFRTKRESNVDEIVDFTSGNFHPGLIIHYRNGIATQAGDKNPIGSNVREDANQLLRKIRAITSDDAPDDSAYDTDGYRL